MYRAPLVSFARLGVAVSVGVLSACGGDSGGGGATPLAADLPPFCQTVLADVEAHQRTIANQRAEGPQYGGTAVVGLVSDLVDGMNVFSAADYGDEQHANHVNLMTLVRYDADLSPLPYLAESWELSEDGRSLTFNLRQDVLWHDGTPTTAQDVAFTFETIMDPVTQYPNASLWAAYESIEVVDDHTVRLTMEPHVGYMDVWRATSIMPNHLLGDVPRAELDGHPYGTRCPVGNGPFVFQDNIIGERWTFVANPEFPEGLGGQAKLDRYVLRPITDQNTLFAELLAGGIDIYPSPLIQQTERIESDPSLQLRSFPFRNYVLVAWNSRQPELADKRVRQAIAHATNRPQVVQVLRQGYATLANATVPPFHADYDAAVEERMPYNPGLAESLLTEAGWIDRDGDGIRENTDGLPLEIGIRYNTGNEERQNIAEIMQAELIQVGIRVIVESVEWGTIVEAITSEERSFDGVVLSWVAPFVVNDAALFQSDRINEPFAFSGTRSDELDDLMRRIHQTTDASLLAPLLAEYEDAVIDEQPYTFLFYPDRIVGLNRRIQGVEMDVRGEWINLREWWIPEAERKYGA